MGDGLENFFRDVIKEKSFRINGIRQIKKMGKNIFKRGINIYKDLKQYYVFRKLLMVFFIGEKGEYGKVISFKV